VMGADSSRLGYSLSQEVGVASRHRLFWSTDSRN
jgi:hypothetical protein